ncbi:zinc-binding dehydrogenase [Nonomuraea sp. NPDC050394]|uniref:zinc-binding dehydrogenase n=1 Tax=Nonomuraea sp. NPDC050394 TaxID=3364363 RepID=UPI003790276D
MRALIFNPELSIATVPEPVPTASQVLIRVSAVSLNFGEVAYHDPRSRRVPGWDASGVVVRAAADGSGPSVGTRVVSFGWSGAWAELRAVDTAELAVVPDSVDLGVAAALPVAGVTAVQAVRRLGPIAGRRVLVTGASGGVGRFAVQLAAREGARVIASASSPARAEGLRALGAAEIVSDPTDLTERVYGVLDTVGGRQLAEAFYRLEDDGVVQAIGRAAKQPTLIDFERAGSASARGRIENFNVSAPFGPDLAHLLALLDQGELEVEIGWRGPWGQATVAANALLSREVRGKAVLTLP